MKHWLIVVLLAVTPVAGWTQNGPAAHVPGQLIVKFRPGVRGAMANTLHARHGAAVIRTSRFANFQVVQLAPGRSVPDMAKVYEKNPNVEYAEPNYLAHAHTLAPIPPNDPYYELQWHLDDQLAGGNPNGGTNGGGINVEPAWSVTAGEGVVVAVVDTGVAYEDYQEIIQLNPRKSKVVASYAQAPDLAQTAFVQGYDFVNDDEHPNDDEGHGTHVAGTIAQSTNNNLGVAGVAPGCSIMPVKVLDSGGSGSYADIADGIIFAANNGAQVINMSLGGPVGSITLEDACAHAYYAGVTIVCSSGNDGSPTIIGYPAAYDAYCIAVGATRYDEAVAYYSNGGASLDLTAPGGDINIDQNGDGYVDGVLQQTHDGSDYTSFSYWFYQGTSMAAPHVSGVAALVVAAGTATTPDEVREALQATAEDKGTDGWDSAYGHGIVDAAAAVAYLAVPNDPPVAAAGGPYAGTEDITVSFDGSGSYDPDGDVLTYSWNFGDGDTGSGPTPTHTYTAGGIYNVTLVVNDGRASSDPDATTASIDEVNDAPVADAGPDQPAYVGEAAIFDGSGSYDIDGEIVAYEWNFGDGGTGSGSAPTHTYAAADIYTVTLIVTDDGGASASDTMVVTVTEAPVESPMHVADLEGTAILLPNRKWVAEVTVLVVNEAGDVVADAVVEGNWVEGVTASDSAITGANGLATFTTGDLHPRKVTSVTFTVTDIVSDAGPYNPSANADADGDTDGTTVTVPAP